MTYFKRILFTFLLLPIVAMSQQIQEDPNLISGKLSNGLHYYLYPTKRVKGQAEFQMFLKAGSLQESDGPGRGGHRLHAADHAARLRPGGERDGTEAPAAGTPGNGQ